VSVLV